MDELIIPVYGLALENNQLDLGNSRIVRTEKALGAFAKSVMEIDFCVCTPTPSGWKSMEDSYQRQQACRNILNRVLTTFKLFQDRVISATNIFYIWGNVFHHDNLPHYAFYKNRKGSDYEKPYLITEAGERRFQAHFELFMQLDVRVSPIRLFNLADFRPFVEERFLDYVISMDGLLVPSKTNITNLFKQYGSLVLGDEVDEEMLESIFKLRHSMVHGNYEEKIDRMDGKTWEELVIPVRQYARQVIVYFHERGLIEDVDKRKKHLESLKPEQDQ